ncbi:ATP-NAD kinase family protein [Ruminococcaceae bacterium OttesenSCG-928-I18]|nr:ATP-NAD kinase family protein [Ruminococcaceae bacterium OttesenSCG-928-I18]
MYKIGLIINPVAGIGGRAGLKGSDGVEIQQKALAAGFKSLAPERVGLALEALSEFRDEIEIITFPSEMGEDVARAAGFKTTVLGSIQSGKTTAEDTIRAAQDMMDAGVDLIVFAGGDGTARNICTAVDDKVPTIGLPCGVKMHSSVYAITPRRAGEVIKAFCDKEEKLLVDGEVMDLDEEAYRNEDVKAKLYGYLKVPEAGALMQKRKTGSGYSQDNQLKLLGMMFVDRMEEDVLYIIGPGSSTSHVMKDLGLQNSLLGVDLVANKKLVANDVNEAQIWQTMQKYPKTEIIATVIGGQGHLFGRGNQQLSPRIIREVGKGGIHILASKQKLADLYPNPFLVDTGDPELDASLCGYIRVPQSRTQDITFKIDR